MSKHLLVVGNAITGFTFFGPFESSMEAIDYALNGPDSEGSHEWCVAPIVEASKAWVSKVSPTSPRCLWCGQEDHTGAQGLGRPGIAENQQHFDFPNTQTEKRRP